MSATGMEPTIDGWILLTENLSPLQNLSIAGLLFLNPKTPLSIIATRDPVTPDNIAGAETWARSNFRRLLYFYCDNYEKTRVQLAGEFLNKSAIVKQLGPIVVHTFSIPLGLAVSFLFAAVGLQLDKWCKRYGKREFNGKGTYSGNFPKSEVESFFDIEFVPAIEEYVDDPGAYPLKGYKVDIKVPQEINGKAKVPLPEDSDEIVLSFAEHKQHSFAFVDTKQTKNISGYVKTVTQDTFAGPNILVFTTDALAQTSPLN